MNNLIFAVRQFAISNLSWFQATRTTIGESAGRERAVNINKDVLKRWYPEGIDTARKELLITTNYLDGAGTDVLSDTIVTDKERPIRLQGGGKNWRLSGDAVPGDFYGSLREGDLMLMMFDNKAKELNWFCVRGDLNNSFGRGSLPPLENQIFNHIIKLLGSYNASQGMWLPDHSKSVEILLQAFKLKDITWSLLKSEEYILQKSSLLHANKKSFSRPDIIFPKNRILYGAPGTGKSKKLSVDAGSEGELFMTIKRITFFPDYSYGQFVGSYKPFPVYRKEENIIDYSDKTESFGYEPLIDYRLVPGPFLESLCDALLNPDRNHLLIIEEINRANVASVFGDVFQLLDRETDEREPTFEGSTYSISVSNEIRAYLNRRVNEHTIEGRESFFADEFLKNGTIRIPANLSIWATMNSADQGVLPLDSAFKRRWSFEYLELDKGSEITGKWMVNFLGREMPWNHLRECINDYLTSNSTFKVAEDKLLGPFFMGVAELMDSDSVNNKLLLYLKDDVLRHSGAGLFFKKENSTLSKIFKAANAEGISPDDRIKNVFCESLAERVLQLNTSVEPSETSNDAL